MTFLRGYSNREISILEGDWWERGGDLFEGGFKSGNFN